jgi:hypothetical protein
MSKMRALWLVVLVGCGRVGFDPVAVTGDALSDPVRLVVGVEGMTASYLYVLQYTPGAPASAAITRTGPIRLAGVGDTRGRGLAPFAPDQVLVGSGQTAVLEVVELDTRAPVRTIAVAGLDNTHGLCALPSGRIVAGEYGPSPNRVNEYTVTPTTSSLASVVTTNTLVSTGTLCTCAAPSDDELYLTEEDANTDMDGDVVRLVRTAPATWQETHRLVGSTLLTAKYGPNHGTGFWTIVVSAGALYAFPIRRMGSQIPTLIRCPIPDIQAANCGELAKLPPDTSAEATLQGGTLVPHTDEILFATNRRLYRYDASNDAWVELLDMWLAFDDLVDASGTPDQMHQVRNLVIW